MLTLRAGAQIRRCFECSSRWKPARPSACATSRRSTASESTRPSPEARGLAEHIASGVRATDALTTQSDNSVTLLLVDAEGTNLPTIMVMTQRRTAGSAVMSASISKKATASRPCAIAMSVAR